MVGVLLDPTLLLAIAATCTLSLLLAGRLAIQWRADRWAVFGLLMGAGAVVLALFVAGGRGPIDLGRFDPRLMSGCFDGSVDTTWSTSDYLNVALYAPVAFFATIVSRRPRASTLGIFMAAFLLELLQNAMDLGVCEELDILRNLLGAIFGSLAGAAASRLTVQTSRATPPPGAV